jgi:hypothetical protein
MPWRERELLLETGERVTVECGGATCYQAGYYPNYTNGHACQQVLN